MRSGAATRGRFAFGAAGTAFGNRTPGRRVVQMAGFAGTDQAGSYDEFLARCLGTGSPFGPVRRIERTRLMSAGAHELVAVVRRGVLSARRVRARGPPPRLETSL